MKGWSRRKTLLAGSATAIVLLGAAAAIFYPRVPADAVAMTLVGYDDKGVAVIQFTNRTRIKLNLNYHTLVWKDGRWQPARRQPQMNPNLWWLAPREARNLGAFPPEEPSRWRVVVECRREDTQLEDWIEKSAPRLGLKVSFRHRYRLAGALEVEK